MVKEGMVPSLPGRPAVIKMEGGWVCYLSIHDSAYLMTLKTWKRRLRDAHPDKGGSGKRFREVYAAKRKWQLQECLWYAQLGMLPPDGCKLALAKVRQVSKRKALTDGGALKAPSEMEVVAR